MTAIDRPVECLVIWEFIMGDAKRRGTFEERKAASIFQQKVEAERKAEIRAEIGATETPERKLRHRDMMYLMMALGMMGAHNPPFKHR